MSYQKAYEIVLDCYADELDTRQEEVAAIKGKLSKLENKMEMLIDTWTDGYLTKDRFLKSKEPIEIDMKRLEQELDELKTFGIESVQVDVKRELDSVKQIFQAIIDFTQPKLSEIIIDCFIAQVLVCKDDTFEVDVNFEKANNIKITCGVEGKKTKKIEPKLYIEVDGEIIYMDVKSPPFRSMQHRPF